MIYIVKVGKSFYKISFTPEQLAIISAMLEVADHRKGDVTVTPLGHKRPTFTWRFLGRA